MWWALSPATRLRVGPQRPLEHTASCRKGGDATHNVMGRPGDELGRGALRGVEAAGTPSCRGQPGKAVGPGRLPRGRSRRSDRRRSAGPRRAPPSKRPRVQGAPRPSSSKPRHRAPRRRPDRQGAFSVLTRATTSRPDRPTGRHCAARQPPPRRCQSRAPVALRAEEVADPSGPPATDRRSATRSPSVGPLAARTKPGRSGVGDNGVLAPRDLRGGVASVASPGTGEERTREKPGAERGGVVRKVGAVRSVGGIGSSEPGAEESNPRMTGGTRRWTPAPRSRASAKR